MSVSTSVLSHKSNTQGKEVLVDVFHITDIPNAMRQMGWDIAPKLMEHWFSIKPAFEFSIQNKKSMMANDARRLDVTQYNKSIVKMSWAIKNPDVSEKITELNGAWNSTNGIRRLKTLLINAGWDGKNTVFLGRSKDVLDLDATSQVNVRPVGGFFDTIDDWYGAIGNATLKIAVSGFTTTFDGEPYFLVESVGFYLKDTYDFLSDKKWTTFGLSEPLGIWSKSGVLDKAKSVLYIDSYTKGLFGYLAREFSGYVPVTNDDFRAWQKKHNAGGDYIVFSDVLWLKPLDSNRLIKL